MSDQPPVASRESRAQVRQMLLIGAVASAVGIALALLIDWFPVPASEQAGPIDTLWDVLLIASVPVFVLVETIVLYCAIKFRMKPGEELKDGPPIHGNTKLEIIWTAIPAILLVALCTYAYVVLTDIEKAEANSMQVRVVGEQFTWTFYYRGENGDEIASPQLYLPANTPVNFTVQSKDVIHDFWVPSFRMKIDAVPGIDTHVRVTTTGRIDEYPVVCAELCGLGHSTMRQSAHVMSREDFDAKLEELANPPEQGGGGGEAAAERPTARPCSPTPRSRRRAARATRWPTPARPGPRARTSTTSWATSARSRSGSRSSIPTRRSRRASSRTSCRATVTVCPRNRWTRWSSI